MHIFIGGNHWFSVFHADLDWNLMSRTAWKADVGRYKLSAMDYPEHLDCAWLACDATGNLAAMITAGKGPVPAEILQNGLLLEIENWLLELRTVGRASLIADVPDPESFVNLSERGFFVYDWTDVHRVSQFTHAYELVCSPETLLTRNKLPAALQAVAFEIDATFGVPFVSVS